MYCPKCGTENQEGALFCKHCGVALKVQQPRIEAAKQFFRRRKILICSVAGGLLVLILAIVVMAGSSSQPQQAPVDPQVSESKDFGVSVGPGGISFQNQHSYSGPSSQNPLQPQPSP